jgi:hypothetical protein
MSCVALVVSASADVVAALALEEVLSPARDVDQPGCGKVELGISVWALLLMLSMVVRPAELWSGSSELEEAAEAALPNGVADSSNDVTPAPVVLVPTCSSRSVVVFSELDKAGDAELVPSLILVEVVGSILEVVMGIAVVSGPVTEEKPNVGVGQNDVSVSMSGTVVPGCQALLDSSDVD